MKPLALYEIANDVVDILPKYLAIRKNAIDRLSNATQTLGPFLVLERQVADLCRRSWIPQL